MTEPEDVPQAAVEALRDAMNEFECGDLCDDRLRDGLAAAFRIRDVQVLRDAADQIGDLRAAMAAVRHTADRLEDQAAELRDLADALSASVPVGDTQHHPPGSMDAPRAEVEGARGVVGEAQGSGESP